MFTEFEGVDGLGICGCGDELLAGEFGGKSHFEGLVAVVCERLEV